MAAQPAPQTRVFVGNLSYKTSAENIGKLFENHGEVTEAIIISRGEVSRGFGFVTMTNAQAAQNAVAALNGFELDGRKIRVEISTSNGPYPAGNRPPRQRRTGFRSGFNRRGGPRRPRRASAPPTTPASPTRIYVRNISYYLKDTEFREAFKDYNITEAVIIRRFDGASRGYGFIECADNATQKKILADHPTIDLRGRTARLDVAHERVPRNTPAQESPKQ